MKKLINYLKASRVELGKVAWPSRMQVRDHTAVVIVISVVVAIFLGTIDFVLNYLFQLVI